MSGEASLVGLLESLKQYGWPLVLLALLVDRFVPVVANRVIPYFTKDRERRQKKQDEDDKHERERRAALEERQVAAWERLADAYQTTSVAVVKIDQRVSHMERLQEAISNGIVALLHDRRLDDEGGEAAIPDAS